MCDDRYAREAQTGLRLIFLELDGLEPVEKRLRYVHWAVGVLPEVGIGVIQFPDT